jgi:GWxTD domain-containing protein
VGVLDYLSSPLSSPLHDREILPMTASRSASCTPFLATRRLAAPLLVLGTALSSSLLLPPHARAQEEEPAGREQAAEGAEHEPAEAGVERAPDANLRGAEQLEDRRGAEADEPAVAEELREGNTGTGQVAAGEDHALPSESPRFKEAYRLLAAAEAKGDPDGLDPVKDLFKDEIEGGRNLARAHNGLGRYYLQQHEHVITVLESIQKLFNWDHITQARKHFRLATDADPTYVEAWYNWAVAGRKAKDADALGEAASALRRVVELDPRYRDAYRLLVVTYRDLGDFEASERALAEWRESPATSLALADLEEAYLKLGVEGDFQAGGRLYWAGLEATRGGEEVDAYYEDLKLILTDDEREAFEKLDPEGKKAWIRAFWEQAADAVVVTADERLAEHYRRLNHVEHSYALSIPQRRHYSSISAYRPREQSGFDDRGVVYLRHGEPDDVARFTGPNVQRNESWYYHRPGGDLIFHFVSDEDTEDFKLVTSLTDALVRGSATLGQGRNSAENVGELFESRSRFDPVYNRLAFQFDPMLLREEEEDVARDVKVGTSTASYAPPSPDSLPFHAFAAAFQDESGAPEVNVYFGVPTSALEMPPGPSGTRMAYSAQVLLADLDGDGDAEGGASGGVAARALDSVAVELPQAPPREQGVLVPGVLQARVPPGDYRYRLRVRDLLSRDTGTLQGEVEVPDFGGFSASSLVLASRVEPSPGGGRFDRGGLKVVPLPSRAFRAGQPIFVYYEVYGLTPADDGRLRFRTEYTIRTREKKRNIAVKLLGSVGNLVGTRRERGEEVGLAVEGEAAPAERLREYISLDLNESEPGPYEIVVEIEDLTTGKKVQRRSPFVLVS